MTKEERFAIIQEAKEMGVDSVSIDGVEYKLGKPSEPKIEIVPDQKTSEFYRELDSLENLSDEEVLYWSVPFYDEIQQQKELHEKALKERQDG